MNRVLGASALIAYLRGEAGADVVERILTDPQSTCFTHALNVSEVYTEFLRVDGSTAALEAVASVPELGVMVRTDLDQQLWMDVVHRRQAHRMSWCDGFGIALARRLSADFVSSDHHELDPVNESGAYVITFFR
jgi:predicted nucleic acid-binding protein